MSSFSDLVYSNLGKPNPTVLISDGDRSSNGSSLDSWDTFEQLGSLKLNLSGNFTLPSIDDVLSSHQPSSEASQSTRLSIASFRSDSPSSSHYSSQSVSLPSSENTSHTSLRVRIRREFTTYDVDHSSRESILSFRSTFSLPEEPSIDSIATNLPRRSVSRSSRPSTSPASSRPQSSCPPLSPSSYSYVSGKISSAPCETRRARASSTPQLPASALVSTALPTQNEADQAQRSISLTKFGTGLRPKLPRSKTTSLTSLLEYLSAIDRGGRLPSSSDRPLGRSKKARYVPSEKNSAKREKVVEEILSSEQVYLEGLNIIVDHFMQPLLDSTLADNNPILPRETINTLFANIVDIQLFSQAFLSALKSATTPYARLKSKTTLASSSSSTMTGFNSLNDHVSRFSRPLSMPIKFDPLDIDIGPQISLTLLKHLPFLSLYHPFVSSFSDASTLLAKLKKEHRPFRNWLAERERDEKCRRLRLGDWLLSVVQRCPRYLLLVKDLLSCTPVDDPEHDDLLKVRDVVENITEKMNARLHDIVAIQKLIALHRSFLNIPPMFSFVVPGRRLLKQGNLLKVCRKRDEDRSFWLFNDCLVYGKTNTMFGGSLGASTSLASLSSWLNLPSSVAGLGERKPIGRQSTQLSSEGEPGKYIFSRFIKLDELTILGVESSGTEGKSFELFSPEESFALIADSRAERNVWIEAIRGAKHQLNADLRTLNTVEEHTMRRHRRRSVQAMPVFSTGLHIGMGLKVGSLSFLATTLNGSNSMEDDDSSRLHKGGEEPIENFTAASFKVNDSTNNSSLLPLSAPAQPERACDACFHALFSTSISPGATIQHKHEHEHEPGMVSIDRSRSSMNSSTTTISTSASSTPSIKPQSSLLTKSSSFDRLPTSSSFITFPSSGIPKTPPSTPRQTQKLTISRIGILSPPNLTVNVNGNVWVERGEMIRGDEGSPRNGTAANRLRSVLEG
ncbi:Predicted Rho/Rac guanine nucleotide exchange factor/faciogenital dysplasia protein 3 [Phaffia rhodozyma]|uniref:Predicted Rho/Rac guanine nucleotide exchange factor/faciogenital dysplasia protein 3 n=1 Tax=Phaffia rhodozyma TaxID=264483 RepID=A0A0F7SRT1_PHARH|nr:Predicted Rho/Rac guanine nucleotide exchange factor/faciogenital dysplasia protein 3 [Phaffia rhodozyma]